jgi:uncharacterized protein with von Willebrand factor type A (vWA) domain
VSSKAATSAAKADEKRAADRAMSAAIGELKQGRDTTMQVPRWDRYQAESEARAEGHFHSALEAHADSPAWANFAREVFSKLYQSGTTSDLPIEQRPLGHEWIGQVHSMAEALPEWRALAARAARDSWACGVAAGEALSALAATVTPPKSDPQAEQDELDLLKDLGKDGQTSAKHLKRMAQKQRDVKEAQEEYARAQQLLAAKGPAVRSALRGAAMRAQEQINEFDEALMTMGAGDAPGIMSRIDAPRAQVIKTLRDNVKLRRIMKRAGRMKAAAIAKQRDKIRPGAEELCDIKPSGDIARLLPIELGMLATEDTEALLCRKLSEKQALTYELRGKEHAAEGPIIMMVDESGSMNGEPDEWAKSIAFAMMEIAARQNRSFIYGHFDTRVSRLDKVEKPRELSLKQICEMCTYFTGGGTYIGIALKTAAQLLEVAHRERDERGLKPWKRADVVLITDGLSGDIEEQKDGIKRIQALGGHVYSFFVGCDPGNEEPCSVQADEKMTITYEDIKGGDPAKLGTIFSI